MSKKPTLKAEDAAPVTPAYVTTFQGVRLASPLNIEKLYAALREKWLSQGKRLRVPHTYAIMLHDTPFSVIDAMEVIINKKFVNVTGHELGEDEMLFSTAAAARIFAWLGVPTVKKEKGKGYQPFTPERPQGRQGLVYSPFNE